MSRRQDFGNAPSEFVLGALKRWLAVPVSDGPHETPEFLQSGVPFVSAEAIRDSAIDFKFAKFISVEDHRRYSRKCQPREGDVLLCKAGATTGKVAFVATSVEFNVWSPLAVLRAAPGRMHRRFLYNVLRSYILQVQIRNYSNVNTQPNIGMKDIANLLVVVPPFERQTAPYVRIVVA